MRPEWEDPANKKGVDLVCRGWFAPPKLTEAWRSLLLMLINGELEDATGVRVTMKADKRGVLVHKLEVWTRTEAVAVGTAAALRGKTGLDFTCVPRWHDRKK